MHDPSFGETVRDAIAELNDREFIEMKGERMYLKTRVDHIRTFEKVVERGKYAVFRWLFYHHQQSLTIS